MKTIILLGFLLTALPVQANTITGHIEVVSTRFRRDGTGKENWCENIGGYSDINPGTKVIVRDANNNIIADGYLGSGTLDGSVSCIFPLLDIEVPDAKYYQFQIGRRNISYSRDELIKKGFRLKLFLGG